MTKVRIAEVLGDSVEYLVTGAEVPKRRSDAEVDSLIRDIRRLSSDDVTAGYGRAGHLRIWQVRRTL